MSRPPAGPRLLRRAAALALALAALPWAHARAVTWSLLPARPSPVPPAPPLPLPLGRLRLDGARVVRPFGWTERAGRPWFAADVRLTAPPGDLARAAAPGRVALVGDDPARFGLYVVLDHGGGWATLYGGCAAVLVRLREPVSRGQPLCLLGDGGPPGPGALIFGLYLDGRPLDPEPYLARGGS